MLLALLALSCAPKTEFGPQAAKYSPQPSSGRLEGFIQLYVEPEAFADTIEPMTTNIDAEPPIAVVDLDESWVSANEVTAEAIRDIIVLQLAAEVGISTPTKLVVRLRGDTSWTVFEGIDIVGKDESTTLGAISSRSRPRVIAPSWPIPGAKPKPPSVKQVARADLVVANIASARAEVAINGVKVGSIGPLTDAVVHAVQVGGYSIDFTVPNGYTRKTNVQTSMDPQEAQTP
ncbi:MAG: hypothetical protein HN348_16905 [Proteobacteria bacterium]|nr:hypothetical protein [Pseudomonadota bacterium]